MSNYFSYFPKLEQDLTQSGNKTVLTNILRRFIIKGEVRNTAAVYHIYDIQESDRPDTIAHKYYGNSSYAWVVLLFNEIQDPIFDWPIFGRDFDNYIKGKYGSIQDAQSEVYEYRKILAEKTVTYDGRIVPEKYVVVDFTTYSATAPTSRRTIYMYDYELELQEKRRKIKILDKAYLDKIKAEVENILKNGL